MKPYYCCSSVKALAVAMCLASSLAPAASLDLHKFWFPKTTVHVVNGMSPGASELNIRCRSTDSDLGYRRTSGGQQFSFSFTRNVWNSTLFRCCFWWKLKRAMIDVYNRYVDLDGKELYFMATEEGIFFKSEKYRDWIYEYPWGYDSETVPGYDAGITSIHGSDKG